MNYTPNYHLPQWDEDDRILRKDFNQMCADIEDGLTGSAGNTQSTFDRFCRLAYNHYCMVQKLDPAPWQVGLFQQNPAKNQEGIGGTETYWNGVRFAGKAGVTLTSEILENCLNTITEMQVTKNQPALSVAMTASFQPPASGTIQNFAVKCRFSSAALNDVFQFRITLTNQDTGLVETTLNERMTFGSTAATATIYYNDTLPFIGGTNYLLTIEPLSSNCTITSGVFLIAPNTTFTTIGNDGVITAEHSFREPACGAGGMMILRCAVYGTGGTLTFLWDGVERKPDMIRTAQTADGRSVQELIYLREDAVPADSRLSLRFEGGENGSFLFYDWGAMLF